MKGWGQHVLGCQLQLPQQSHASTRCCWQSSQVTPQKKLDLLKETVINEALFQLTRHSGKGQGAAARSCPLKVTQELDVGTVAVPPQPCPAAILPEAPGAAGDTAGGSFLGEQP